MPRNKQSVDSDFANLAVNNDTELGSAVLTEGEGGGGAVAWGDIEGVPAALTSAPAAGTAGIRAIGATGTTVVAGNDARLTDARTPTTHTHAGADISSGTVPFARIPTGTTASTVALGNHGHGNGLMAASAPPIADATEFADLPAAVTAHNALLAALRTRGVIA